MVIHLNRYKHLTLEEREKLYALKEQKFSLRDIALKLNRFHTTLSRELRRNKRFLSPYIPCHAHTYAKRRIQIQRATAALKQQVIYNYVLEKLKLKWWVELLKGTNPAMKIFENTVLPS